MLQAETLPAIFQGKIAPDNEGCYLYARSFSPTVAHLARQLATMEGTEDAYCCASGMAAISSALLNVCNAGDWIVASRAVYGGTHALLRDFLPHKCNIHTLFVDITDIEAVKSALLSSKAKVLYAETLSNPTLVVADVPELAAVAHDAGACFVIDNTFTPMILSPALLGADVVVHSLTKFISGAADVVAGVVCGSKRFVSSLMNLTTGPLMLLGPVLDPQVAAQLSLRLPHLPLRIQEHSRRAEALARRLEQLGAKVTYPGLRNHPQHQLLSSMANCGMYGFGGIFTIEFETSDQANAFMESLQNEQKSALMAVSLGYFDSLVSASDASTSSELSEDEKKGAGIRAGLVRLSVGLTGTLEERVQEIQAAWRATTVLASSF